ncbi:MAG: hypothetical protein R8M14_07315 [Ghiorsea sp.]
MNKSPKEKAATRKDKLLSHTNKSKHNIDEARAHLLGVCLLDASYIKYLPSSIHFSQYGALTIAMIKQGMGIEGMAWHLEAVGLDNAKEMLLGSMVAIPDRADYSRLFCNAIQVLIFEGVSA